MMFHIYRKVHGDRSIRVHRKFNPPCSGAHPSVDYSMLGPRQLDVRCSAKDGGSLGIHAGADHQRLLHRGLLVQRQIGHAAGRGLGGVLTLTLITAIAHTRASKWWGWGFVEWL